MSMSRPLSNESNVKIPNIISLDLDEKKMDSFKLKETFSSFRNTYHNLNPSTIQNFKYNNFIRSNNNYTKNTNNHANNLFKNSTNSCYKLKENNDLINNKHNFIYFSNANVNNNKKESLPFITNFNYFKELNDIGYTKNIRNDEMKLRKLINKRRQNRLESINNHHYETLRENLKNSTNGLYLTSLLKQNTNDNDLFNTNNNDMSMRKDSLNFKKNENIFQQYVFNSNLKNKNEEEIEGTNYNNINYNIQNTPDSNVNNAISENLFENNKDSEQNLSKEKNELNNINYPFSNEEINKNLITDKNILKSKQDNKHYLQLKQDSLEEIFEQEHNAYLMKKNSIKELRKINHYFISKVFKKKNLNLINNSFSYKDINEEYQGLTEKEAELLNLNNIDINKVSELSKEDSSIDKNRLLKMRNSMLFQQLQLNEKEIVPLAFLKNNTANETVEKNIITMKLAKKHYLEEEKYNAYYNRNNNKNNKEKDNQETNNCSTIELAENRQNEKIDIENDENNYLEIPKKEKIHKLRNEKKRFLSQILNNSDDEDYRNFDIKKIKAKENQRLLRPSLTLFKNTLYQMKNEINYTKDLNDDEKGLSPYEKLLIKINNLFKTKFEDKGKFINKIKETFMIENQLKIKEEHTKQIDEFYETKLGSLKDSIKSIKIAEDLFADHYLIKFYEYLRHVNLQCEMEKQNLNKLKQNKNELDIDIIKLNSNIHKIRDKLAVYTEYRNFMICVKERRIQPPAFFSDISNSQEELKMLASRRLIAIEKKIILKRKEIAKLEGVLKGETDKKNNKITNRKNMHPKNSNNNLNSHSSSSHKNIHVSNSSVNNNATIQKNKEHENNYFNDSSKNVITKNVNNESSSDVLTTLNSNLNKNNNIISAKKLISSEKIISKNDPNYERVMLEHKIEEENSYLDFLYKEKEEYSRYFNYLTEPIFVTFEEFYSELKKLEIDNITKLNKMNENSTILYRTKMELYEMKADDERAVKKYQSDLIIAQAKANEARSRNKDLKDKLNRLIIAMRKNTNGQNNKSKVIGLKNLTSSTTTSNFFSLKKSNLEDNNLSDNANPLAKTISGNFSEINSYDYESAESARNAKKPGYFGSIFNTFQLVNEIKKFEKLEILKPLPIDEQALIMLQHIEHNINLLLHRHENYKKNPQTKNKLNTVTNEIEKENRAKKSTERMKQVLENHKKMIERVNYKFNRLNVLPKRKCAPRFRPKDSVNPSGLYNTVNFNKNNNEDDNDFLDII